MLFQGIDAEAYLWVGLFTAKGVPAATLTKMRDLIRRAASDASFKQALEKAGVLPDYREGAAFQQFFDTDYARMAKVVKLIGKL